MKLEFLTIQKVVVLLVLSAILRPTSGLAVANRVSLAGWWRFQLDREDGGVENHWFERTMAQRLYLPGALQNQGFGDEITVDTQWTGDVGADRWLQGRSTRSTVNMATSRCRSFSSPSGIMSGLPGTSATSTFPTPGTDNASC